MLVWLSKLSGLGLENKIRADLPRKEAEPELRDLVQGSQLDWASSGWPQRERPTAVERAGKGAELVVYPLTRMRRCQCPALRWKLELLRGATPSGTQLKDILRGHRAPSGLAAENQANPTLNDVRQILRETPNTLMLTITRRGADKLNCLAIEALFGDSPALQWLPCDPDANLANFHESWQLGAEPAWLPLHHGTRVTLTRNLDKANSFVNGMMATVRGARQNGVEVLTDSGVVLLIHPYTQDFELADGQVARSTFHPLRAGYATTLMKIQGATVDHATIWLDAVYVQAATTWPSAASAGMRIGALWARPPGATACQPRCERTAGARASLFPKKEEATCRPSER